MVRKINALYQCEECRMYYQEKALAEKCEAWCKKYKSCNLNIVKYAMEMKGGKKKNDKKS